MERQQHDGQAGDGVGSDATQCARLVPMSRLESWTLVEGEPDIRGWEVRTIGGRRLGAVGDLLIDGAAGEVVLLDIDLPASDRRTFVPVQVVDIDRTRHLIVMDSADLPETDSPRAERSTDAGRAAPSGGRVHLPAREREVRRQVAPSEVPRHDPAFRRHPPGDQRIERLSTDF